MHLNIEISILIQNFGIDHELNVKREGRKIMNTIVYNDDNWLFPNQPLKTHDISYDDIQYLLNCADIDDRWADNIQKMVQDRDEHPEKRGDFIIDEFRVMNASGTTILFPYGDRIITFFFIFQLISVLIKPGATPLTVMPRAATSLATDLVKPMQPAFAAA